nr:MULTISPECIES: hypothetical protein [unclassified Microbacterium]
MRLRPGGHEDASDPRYRFNIEVQKNFCCRPSRPSGDRFDQQIAGQGDTERIEKQKHWIRARGSNGLREEIRRVTVEHYVLTAITDHGAKLICVRGFALDEDPT